MMDPLTAALLASGGGSILSALFGGGSSGMSAEQKRLLNIQGDVAATQRDLIQSRAANESANMPQVLQTIFQAVNNQLGKRRTQVLGPNFQPRLQQRGTVSPITSKWTPYTGTEKAPTKPAPGPAATGPKVKYPSYDRGVPPMNVADVAALVSTFPDDLAGIIKREFPDALAGNVRRVADNAVAPDEEEALANPYFPDATSGSIRPNFTDDSAGSMNLPPSYTPPGDFVPPGGRSGDVDVPPGGTVGAGGGGVGNTGAVDVAGQAAIDAMRPDSLAGLFPHLPPIVPQRPDQVRREWEAFQAALARGEFVPMTAEEMAAAQADPWTKFLQMQTDPSTGQAAVDAQGRTYVKVIRRDQPQPSMDSLPPEVQAGLANGTFQWGDNGKIYNLGGQLVYEAPRVEPVAPAGEDDTLPPLGPRSLGPRKIRR